MIQEPELKFFFCMFCEFSDLSATLDIFRVLNKICHISKKCVMSEFLIINYSILKANRANYLFALNHISFAIHQYLDQRIK